MIFIDTSFELKKKAGIGVYINTLIACLKINKIKYECIDINLPENIRYKSIWYYIWLNSVVFLKTLLKKPEVYIAPSFMMPYFKRKGTKYVTVIHDLCAYRENEMPSFAEKYYRFATEQTIKRADTIVTVSETVKNELISKFDVNPDRIKMVHNAIADYFIDFEDKPEILEKYGIDEKKYILSVATLNKRKNIPELTKAFEKISDKYPDLKLVLVGGMGNEQRENLTKHSNVIFTGYIKDEEIPILYKNALSYVCPSLYEGFGSIIMEAQYSRTPLICSDISIFHDTAGEGAEFCTPDANGIAEKIEYLINDPQRREELKKLGCENVKRFDIERVAEQLNEVLNG